MSRIRTVKPELFKHEDLFDAEQNSKLPLRLAFIGLFTVADREGRFKWRPRTLKLDILPHDFIDFATILDALAHAGFIERYEIEGEIYGWIPTFTKHQRFTGKEAETKSLLPPPPQQQRGNSGETTGKHPDASPKFPGETTGKLRGTQEGNGIRERKGKGMDTDAAPAPDMHTAPLLTPSVERSPAATEPTATPMPESTANCPEVFEALWHQYPHRNGSNPKNQALKAWNARLKEGHSANEMLAGVKRYAAWCAATDKLNTEYVKQASTFLGAQKGFAETWEMPVAAPSVPTPRNSARYPPLDKNARLLAGNQSAIEEWLGNRSHETHVIEGECHEVR
jgi:hypothetical protein